MIKMPLVNVTKSNARPLLIYWGRRGSSRLAFELMQAAIEEPGVSPFVSVSRTNEIYTAFANAFADRLLPVKTFSCSHGAVTAIWRIALLRRRLARLIQTHRITAVIDLMPHIWAPLIIPVITKAGVPYIAIAHDAQTHPGDYRTRIAKRSADRVLAAADHVLTLSQTVADALICAQTISPDRLSVLFHPDLNFAETDQPHSASKPASPIRLAFIGRIMPYKGLPLFVKTIETLRQNGLDVACGVFGEGPLGPEARSLEALNAEIINRWLSEQEMAAIFSRYDAILASHIEASQSGVIAAALGAGIPAVVTPVGGLAEQVREAEVGIVSEDVSADALAEAVRHLFLTPGLYDAICRNIGERADQRSMRRFVRQCLAIAGTLS
jgi:glycosyltransferase involved in cell wall biosynthesis